MIPVNELRIGNYVESPLGEIMKVTILGDLKKPDYIHAKNNEGFGQNGFEPIPLTPEILEKCGIKSLHQLQNLYFALTGEELNINL